MCVGCGTCVEIYHTNSLRLNEDYFCPENAISIVENERIV